MDGDSIPGTVDGGQRLGAPIRLAAAMTQGSILRLMPKESDPSQRLIDAIGRLTDHIAGGQRGQEPLFSGPDPFAGSPKRSASPALTSTLGGERRRWWGMAR